MTLTEVSYYSRKLAPFFLLVFIVLLIFFYSVKLFFMYLDLNKTTGIQYHTEYFKQIRSPSISNASSSAGYNFTIDTIEGEPVTATEAGQVYFLPKSQISFGYQQKIYLIAKAIGFDVENIKHKLINDTEAVFDDGNQELRIDITNFNFTYTYNIQKKAQIFEGAKVPQKEEAEQKAIDFLKSFDRYPSELAKGKTNAIFFKFDLESSTAAVLETNQEANMVEIDFYRPDIDTFPIVSPTYYNSQNYVTLVNTDNGMKVISAQIKFYEKSEEQIGIYPIITGKEAYAKLSTGSAILVSPASSGKKDIVIKKMFMGYFDPKEYQEYLQPVYVFLGDDGFVAYVPAVTDEWLVDPNKL